MNSCHSYFVLLFSKGAILSHCVDESENLLRDFSYSFLSVYNPNLQELTPTNNMKSNLCFVWFGTLSLLDTSCPLLFHLAKI